MHKLIILEGPDQVGKTTLATQLVEHIPYSHRIHFTGPSVNKSIEEQKIEQYDKWKRFIKYLDTAPDILILDRSFLGELVYSQIRTNTLCDGYWEEVLEILNKYKILSILLYSTGNDLKRFNIAYKTGQYIFDSIDLTEKISNMWLELFVRLPGSKHVFNNHNFDSLEYRNQRIIQFCLRWLNNEGVFISTNDYSFTMFSPNTSNLCPMFNTCSVAKQHCTYQFGKNFNINTWGIGNMKGKYVFVGEAPGYKGCGKLGIPFYNDASGTLFRNILFDLNIDEIDCYITNVVKCNPLNNTLPKDYVSLHCAQNLLINEIATSAPIIACGKTASTMLTKLNIKHISVYHPAYFLYKHIKYPKILRYYKEHLI